MAVAGNIVLTEWTVLDLAGDPLTGMTSPADITFTLHRTSGSTMIAASEVISFVEIGATGHYYISFTPANSGLYVLQLREIDAATMGRASRFDFQVLSAGAAFAPSYADAFCAETDVERYLLQPITATTKPNDTEVAGFAQGRADALESLCAALGNAVTPATVTPASRLEGLLREANAIGAAMDATVAQVFGTGTSKTEKAEALMGLWQGYVGRESGGRHVAGTIETEIRANLVSLATSHTLSGDTTPRAAENAPQDQGLQVRMGDLY